MSLNLANARASRFKSMSKGSRSVIAMILAALLIALVALVGGSVNSASAETRGAGEYRFGFWHGQYITTNGSILYCLDTDLGEPIGIDSSYLGQTNTIDSLPANQVAGLNWLVSTYGQTSDNYQARTVAEAIWLVMDAGYPASDPQSNSLANQVRNYVSTPPSGTGSVGLNLAVDPVNNFVGTVTISSLSHTPATGTLTLVNGKFNATGTSTITGSFTVGQSLGVYGVPPTQNGAPYKINVTANLQSTISAGYGSSLGVWNAAPNYQRMISPGTPNSGVVVMNGFAEDPFSRSTQFAPIVTTNVVSKFVQEGGTFSDTLTFATTTDDAGTNNPWTRNPANNNYAPITSTGVIYGPFETPPVQSANIPAGAPIAGTATVTTSPASGPTINYTATTTETATGSGYYTWVWTIAQSAQIPAVQPFLLDDYLYTDQFGRVAETHVVPQKLIASTTVSDATVGYTTSKGVTDSLDIDNLGNWTKDAAGVNIPVVLRGDVYFVPGDIAPVTTSTVPGNAVLLESITQEVSSEGTVVSSPVIPNTNFTTGYVVWVWKVVTADQPAIWQGYTSEWTDSFGVPSEMTRVVPPTVTTAAQPEIALTDNAYDVATIGGTMPTENTYLGFQAYLQPTDSTTPICDATTLAFESANLITVASNTGANYQSEDVKFAKTGNYFWIETLYAPGATPPVAGDLVPRGSVGNAIATGECGAIGETSVVSIANVTTVATTSVDTDGKAFDTALVNGQVPVGAYLTFKAYRELKVGDARFDTDNVTPLLGTDGKPVLWTAAEIVALNGAAVCTPATEAFSSATNPVAVTAGINDNVKYESPSTVFGTAGRYYWVEKLVDRDGNALHTGECGFTTEITTVKNKVIDMANTGTANDNEIINGGAWLIAVSALLGLLAASVVVYRRKTA